MSAPQTMPVPTAPPAMTVIRGRTPKIKYHRTKGQAKNAVLAKVHWDGRSIIGWADVDLYALRGEEYVLVRSWKSGEPFDRADLDAALA